MPLPNLEVVGIVRRRNLHRASAKFAVHHLVRDDRNPALHQWQQHVLAYQMPVTLILRVYCHGRIAQHRLRPRRCHNDVLLRPHNRIAYVPQMPLPIFVQHLQVAQHGQAHRAPVHHPLRAIDQPLLIQLHEHHAHHARKLRRKRKFLPRPVAAFPDLLHLPRDLSAALFLPFPYAPDKFFAAQLPVIDSLRRQLPHHDALRGDPSMIHPRQIQSVVSAHAMPPRQDINLRVVQHVPDMQRPGHIGRRDNDREYRSRRIRVRPKELFAYPEVRPSRLNLLRFIIFGDFASHPSPCSLNVVCSATVYTARPHAIRLIFDYTRRNPAPSIRIPGPQEQFPQLAYRCLTTGGKLG